MAHLLSVSCSAGDVRLDASGWLHQHQGTRGAPICLGSVCKVTPLSHVNDLRDVFFFSPIMRCFPPLSLSPVTV